MYVAFDADFKVPRPIPIAPTSGALPSFGFSKNSDGTLNAASGTYVGQGSNVSTTNVNNTYTLVTLVVICRFKPALTEAGN
jgi:hypothetical protein